MRLFELFSANISNKVPFKVVPEVFGHFTFLTFLTFSQQSHTLYLKVNYWKDTIKENICNNSSDSKKILAGKKPVLFLRQSAS